MQLDAGYDLARFPAILPPGCTGVGACVAGRRGNNGRSARPVPASGRIRSCEGRGGWPGSCSPQIGLCIVCAVYFHAFLAAKVLGILG